MLKKGLQGLGLLFLFIFSFLYTDKIVKIVKSKDPIMIKINHFENIYNIDAVNAIINDNEIIPGINGCIVDKDRSYSMMKRINKYNPNMIEYRELKPELSLDKIYDKYIVKGNKNKNEVAFIFKLSNKDDNLNDILRILNEYNIKASFFIDGKYLEENPEQVYEIIKLEHEIYNLGYNSKYEKDTLLWTNSIIDTIANNKSKYCLVMRENIDVLILCANHKMHTIKANLVVNYSNTLSLIKNKIEKGSMIVFEINNNTKSELIGMIIFLNTKGYKHNLLSEHLSEKGCF